MLTVHVLAAVVGDTQRQTIRLHDSDELPATVAEAIERFVPATWRSDVSAWINDLPATEQQQLEHGDRLILAPRVRGPVILLAPFFTSSIYAAAAYAFIAAEAYKKLFSPPIPPIEAGDQRSPTYAWDGIRTNYGTGFGIPVFYGRHAAGGQVISVHVQPFGDGGTQEVLNIVLLLSEGRCHSLGTGIYKVFGNAGGEADDIGNLGLPFPQYPPIPGGLKANGNLLGDFTTKMHVRFGEPGQSPPPVSGPAKTDNVGEPLDADGAQVVHTVNEQEIGGVAFAKLVFPAGLYEVDGSGNQRTRPVTFRMSYRRQGDTAWKFLPGGDYIVGGDIPRDFRFSWFIRTQEFIDPLGGPWEVRVERLSSQGGGGTPVDQCVVEQMVYYSPHLQSYPASCIVALTVLASETLSGGYPNWHLVGEWRRLRVYDDIEGLSDDEYWDLPTSGPFAGIWTYPPGRNPAWVCMDAITSGRYGLGKYYRHADLDLEAFRDWADLCDETVVGPNGNEARYTFDGPCDNSGASGWDEIQRIARCGRAAIQEENGKLVPKFEWRDAFGRGTNSVPARARQHLLTDANTDVDVEVLYVNTRSRPTVIDVQILNEDLDYEQDLIPIEDPNAEDLNAPFKLGAQSIRRETENLLGCVRPSQARRHALYRHEQNRLGKATMTASAALEHLDVRVGDIVGVQTTTTKLFDSPTSGHRATVSGVRTGAAGIKVDGEVELDAGGQFVAVDVDGIPQTRTITNGAGTYPAGTTLTFSGADVEIPPDAPVAFGYAGKVVKDFIVTSSAISQDFRRVIAGVEWVPSAHDDDATPPGGPDDPALDPGSQDASTALGPAGTFPAAAGVTAYDARPGASTIAVERPDGFRGRRARVYGRKVGAGGLLAYLGETDADRLQVPRLTPHTPHELVATFADAEGHFGSPDPSGAIVVVPEEFPPEQVAAVTGQAALPLAEGLLLTWDPLDGCDHYEVRRTSGARWCGAELVGRTKDTRLRVPADGIGTSTYVIRGRSRAGIYSHRYATIAAAMAAPQNTVPHGTTVDIAAGTGSSCSYSGGLVTLDAGAYDGTWTLDELDLGQVADWLWLVHALFYWRETRIVDDFASEVIIGSGESKWWTTEGREPTRGKPGEDFSFIVDDLTDQVEAYFASDSVTNRQTTGEHARTDIEIRYHDGTSWSAWQRYVPQRYIAQKCQVRARLRRRRKYYEPTVAALSVAGVYGDGTRL